MPGETRDAALDLDAIEAVLQREVVEDIELSETGKAIVQNTHALIAEVRQLRASRTPPAAVVCYIARDTGVREFGDTWLYAAHPGTPDDDGAYNNGRLAEVIGRMPLEWSKALGLAPGECAAFRITREEAE